jgi:hypothetical protein
LKGEKMELRTRPIQQQEDRILTRLALAQDTENNAAICNAELDLLDFYNRAGCLSPDIALLASLLIMPDALTDVREILPDSATFDDRNDRRLYEAMLCTPHAELTSWWLMLSKVSGFPLRNIFSYMDYDFFNCAHVKLYAAQLLNRWAYNAALNIAQHVIEDFVNGQTMRALSVAGTEFSAIHDKLDAARPLINGARKRTPDFGRGAK